MSAALRSCGETLILEPGAGGSASTALYCVCWNSGFWSSLSPTQTVRVVVLVLAGLPWSAASTSTLNRGSV